MTLVHLTAIIHHHFILDSEVLGVDSFSFYWRCDHFNVQTSMTIKTEACFRMEASERKRVRIAETENIDKFSLVLTAQETQTKTSLANVQRSAEFTVRKWNFKPLHFFFKCNFKGVNLPRVKMVFLSLSCTFTEVQYLNLN